MCILARMVKTPLAMLRRLSGCPKQMDAAAKLGVIAQSLMNVESGRTAVSDDFIERLAKVLKRPAEEVMLAYLETRKGYLRSEAEQVAKRLTALRGGVRPARRKSA
jgi:transcriptional regulator with XRE-family HTH domain